MINKLYSLMGSLSRFGILTKYIKFSNKGFRFKSHWTYIKIKPLNYLYSDYKVNNPQFYSLIIYQNQTFILFVIMKSVTKTFKFYIFDVFNLTWKIWFDSWAFSLYKKTIVPANHERDMHCRWLTLSILIINKFGVLFVSQNDMSLDQQLLSVVYYVYYWESIQIIHLFPLMAT